MTHPNTPTPAPDTPIFAAFLGVAIIVAAALMLQVSGPPADHAATPPLVDAELAGTPEAPVPNLAQAPH